MNEKPCFIITGGNGEIGCRLVSKLNLFGAKVLFYSPELKAPEDAIFIHMAAKRPNSSANEIINSNIIFHQEVIRFCEVNNVKKFFFFSTASIYNSSDAEYLEENSSVRDLDIYSLSKIIGEELLKSSKISNVLSLRLPGVLEYTRPTNFISKMGFSLRQNRDFKVTNLNEKFNFFTTTEEILNFILSVKFSDKFDVVNFASAPALTLGEIYKILLQELSSSSKLIDAGVSKVRTLSIAKSTLKYKHKYSDPRIMLLDWAREIKGQ